jgi:hypothetical protein
MIGDELGPQSVADDIRGQSARPMPKQVDIRVWIAIAIIIGLLFWVTM